MKSKIDQAQRCHENQCNKSIYRNYKTAAASKFTELCLQSVVKQIKAVFPKIHLDIQVSVPHLSKCVWRRPNGTYATQQSTGVTKYISTRRCFSSYWHIWLFLIFQWDKKVQMSARLMHIHTKSKLPRADGTLLEQINCCSFWVMHVHFYFRSHTYSCTVLSPDQHRIV